jgi:hypothetical protein
MSLVTCCVVLAGGSVARGGGEEVFDACARRIVEGLVSPADGAHRLCRLVANEAGFEGSGPLWAQVGVFVGLASEWEHHEGGRASYERGSWMRPGL